MGITQQQREILNQANFTEGGINFISDMSKIDIQNEPILVVGLGGSGIDAMLRVKSKVNEIFKTGKDKHSGKRKTVPDNVKFIGIDTDKSNFVDKETGKHGRSYRGMFVEADEALNIGTTTLSGFVQHAVENNYAYITDWLASGVAIEDASNGANGVRQIARLCLFNSFNDVYNKFTRVISELTSSKKSDPNSKLYVFVLGGISGGTGSGTFIDIPYIIQTATKEALGMNPANYIWDRLVMFGYFITPDINEKNHKAPRIGCNGYAAMKELDYLMGIEDRKETFEQDYGPRSVYSKNKPYTLVNFVSSYFEGGTPVEDAYDTAMQVIAENVIFFVANDANDVNLGPWGFQNNVNTDIDGMVNNMAARDLVKPVGYKYGIIGSSGRILPVQDIMTCLASKLLDRINEMWDAHGEPTDREVMQIVGPAYFAIDPASLTKRLMSNVNRTFQDIRQRPMEYPLSTMEKLSVKGAAPSPDFQQMFQSICSAVDNNYGNKEHFIDAVRDNLMNQLKQFFENTAPILFPDPLKPGEKPNYGPRFANDVLVGMSGGTSLNANLFCYQQINTLTAANNEISGKLQGMMAATQNALSELQTSFMHKKDRYNDYMTAMESVYNLMLQQHINTRLITAYQDIMEIILDANKQIFGVIYETLKTLHGIFDENMSIMGNVDKRKSVEGVVMSWYVVSFTDVNSKIEQMLAARGLEVPVNDLYRFIWNKKENWSTENVGDYTVFEDLASFLSTEFSEVLDLGLEAFLEEEFRNNPGEAKSFPDYIEHKFDNDLMRQAAIMFNDRPGFKVDAGDLIPGRLLIQVPKSCNTILTAINKAHAGNVTEQVAPSDSKSRITYTKALYGVPIYSYAIIENYEAEYESQLKSNGSPGIHLHQHGDVNWEDLPALCPEQTWSANYQNPREKERVNKANAIFDKALEYGVIRYSEEHGAHIAIFAGDLDVDGILEETGASPNAIKATVSNLRKYLDVSTDLPNNPGNTNADADGYERILIQRSRTVESAKMWFASSYELIKRVEKENAKYDRIAAAVEKLQSDLGNFDTYFQFANAYLTETLLKRGPKYFFDTTVEGIEPIELVSNSQLKNKDYPHFELYKLIYNDKILPDSQFAQFKKDVDEKFKKFEDSDYDSVYVPAITALADELKAKISNAEFDRDSIADADELITFYKVIVSYLDGIK